MYCSVIYFKLCTWTCVGGSRLSGKGDPVFIFASKCKVSWRLGYHGVLFSDNKGDPPAPPLDPPLGHSLSSKSKSLIPFFPISFSLQVVETIPTDAYPYYLYHLHWLNEVWVHAWTLSTFDVINTGGKLNRTHKSIRAHVQPG